MPRALQTIAGYYTAGAAGTGTATPAPGDTFAVPSFSLTSTAWIESVSAAGASTDWVRIRSARMHDPNQGLRMWLGGTQRRPLIPWGSNQVLYPSDTPTVEIDETAAATGGILVTYGYADLPGVSPRLATWADVQPRIAALSGVEVDVTSGVIGAWGNGAAINSSFDNFKAGDDYALLGYTCSVACLGIALLGTDTGGLKVGAPGDTDPLATRNHFINLSDQSGRACIPIIAADNKAGTMLQNVDVAANTATKVTLIFAQLQ